MATNRQPNRARNRQNPHPNGPRPTSSPAKAEALGDEITFDFENLSFTVPPPAEWDVDAIEALEAGKMVTCLRALLGDRQWAAFKARARKLADLEALFDAMQAAGGIQGN